jgi:hypothetical protein
MDYKTCECGRQFTEEQSSGEWCFRCKLDGLGFSWVGGGSYGRKAFHDKTIAEAQRDMLAGAKRAGKTLHKLPEKATW